jgi:hypothetical protein
MNFGFVLPGGTAQQQLELAVLAEEHGWDGVFVWEAAYGVDPWTLMAAMAQRTSRVKLGTMLTPLPWRRPWKLASQIVTLDQVSEGRAIVSIGLGAVATELGQTGEVEDRKARAEMMDEGIDIMRGLWQGNLAFEGKHYSVDLTARDELLAVARPVQERIPIWTVAVWPRMKSMRRLLRCDGIIPALDGRPFEQPSPGEIKEILAWLRDNGAREGFDFIVEGETQADDLAVARDRIGPLAEAGATWWMETRWELPHHTPERLEDVRQRLKAGPPKL